MKTVDQIYEELLKSFGERTGLEPREGCDLSARLYAVAAQVYALYVQADWVARRRGSIWTVTPSSGDWRASQLRRRRGRSASPPGRPPPSPGRSPRGRCA